MKFNFQGHVLNVPLQTLFLILYLFCLVKRTLKLCMLEDSYRYLLYAKKKKKENTMDFVTDHSTLHCDEVT